MSDEIETFKVGGATVKLCYDLDCSSPREDDNTATMVLHHRRYNLPCEVEVPETNSLQELIDLVVVVHDAKWFFPVWGYEHGALMLKAGERVGQFADRWDSGLAGLIFVSRTACLDYTVSPTYPTEESWARAIVDGEIDAYNDWANGSCYGYVVEDEAGEHIDSCWGYVGDLDYVRSAAIEAASSHNACTARWANDDVSVVVEYQTMDDGRRVYGWTITVPVQFGAVDLRSGANAKVDAPAMLETLAGFLGAWAEASEDGENHELFPAEMRLLPIDWETVAAEMAMDVAAGNSKESEANA